MPNTISLGKFGEDLASRYLVGKGYRILERNYRKPFGEIDIIAKAKDGTLVFFEVKTISKRGDRFLTPEDQMSKEKLRKLRRICQMFAIKNQTLVDEDKGWRIDLIAITADRLTNKSKNDIIKHYENI